jgi:2,4-dienoyl-CoA reductase-like NADH-dependent reductase (Old Yellow Enzyme family)/NADPH-dependent 2,4-dienoyl-CoA reductase/sulfur reductase-like enzyme
VAAHATLTGPFAHLLAPGRLGPLELPNRVLLPAMDMNLCDDGVITAGEIEHYTARAAGGAAMVITGSGAVAFPHGATTRNQPGLSDDRFVPGLRALAGSVHAVGGRLCIQLCHHGKTSAVDTAEDRALLVPSVPTDRLDLSALQDNTMDELMKLAAASQGKTPRYEVADDTSIAWVIDQFAGAAARVRDAGADGVEIHAAHGYLLSAFLSAAYNHRDDDWGGPIDRRARLTCEVIAAVRAAVGPDLAVLVRVNAHEYGVPDGLRADEVAVAAPLFVAAGADAIHVSANAHNPFADFTEGPLPSNVGQYREFARTIKAAVDVPVIAVGRLLPETAEEMLAAGDCDFVSMGRQQLADPELVDKLRSGRRASVRPCINCYVCVEQNFFEATPRCSVNPALGHEDLARPNTTTTPRHVVVVGGGPGGMETARVAAARGHRVTLLEHATRLGGTAWFSQLTTPANAPLVDWLEHEIRRLGVDVHLGRSATVAALRDLDPDVVVVATGAVRGRPEVAGSDLPHVQTGDGLRALITGSASTGDTPRRSLLERAALTVARSLRLTDDPSRIRELSKRWMPIGSQVVVLGGGLVGLELAEFLAERGRAVTVLEPGPALGLAMAMPRRWTAVRRATEHGVTLVRNAAVVEITAHEVVYRVGDDEQRVTATDVVVADEVRPDRSLADELRAAGFQVEVVGDAAEVGYIDGAIHSAWSVAHAV